MKNSRRGSLLLRQRLMKSTGGAAEGAGSPRKCESGLDLVAGLNFLDVLDVAGIEKLGAIEHKSEFRLAADHRLDAFRLFAFPFRADER